MFQLILLGDDGSVTHWPKLFETAEDADFTACQLVSWNTWSIVELA